MRERWEHYDNGARGIGVRGFGDTAADAFEQAALALTARVWLDGTRLTAHARGEPVNPERHELRLQVKGARPDTPRVARHGEGWVAQAIMDF